jgi:hypothetical protein
VTNDRLPFVILPPTLKEFPVSLKLFGIQILKFLWWILAAGEALSADHTE